MILRPAYLGYRAGSTFSRLLPAAAVRPVSRVLGRIGTGLMAGRADQVARHQRRARPDLSPADLQDAVRSVFASYAHYWIESFRLPGTPPSVLDDGLTHDGFAPIREAIDAGQGVILALPHLGAWEWAAFWMTAVQGIPLTAVVEPVEPPELAEWFVGLREDLGMEIVTLGPDAGTRAARAVSSGHLLTLLCDRDVGGGGVEVEFFGERTTLPAGPATLAIRSGAPLIPAAVYFDGDGHHAVARGPIDTTRRGRLRDDVTRVTQALAVELEGLIRQAPEQWHLLQPNWPSDGAAAAAGTGG